MAKDTSDAFRGVDEIYQNHSSVHNQPFRSGGGIEKEFESRVYDAEPRLSGSTEDTHETRVVSPTSKPDDPDEDKKLAKRLRDEAKETEKKQKELRAAEAKRLSENSERLRSAGVALSVTTPPDEPSPQNPDAGAEREPAERESAEPAERAPVSDQGE